MRQLSERVSFSASWVYQTGNAISLPKEQFGTYNLAEVQDGEFDFSFLAEQGFQSTHYYDGRNNFRTPGYHRLDFNFSIERPKRRGKATWNLGCYNAYSQLNPYYLYFDRNSEGQLGLYKFSLFPILPAIAYVRNW